MNRMHEFESFSFLNSNYYLILPFYLNYSLGADRKWVNYIFSENDNKKITLWTAIQNIRAARVIRWLISLI